MPWVFNPHTGGVKVPAAVQERTTSSNEKYEPCLFRAGEWFGTPEEAFEVGAVNLLA